MDTKHDSDGSEKSKKLDRLCLRMPPEDAEWLIAESAKQQLAEKRIVPVTEFIADIFADRYSIEKPDRKAQRPNDADKITYLPLLTPELRAALEAEREQHKAQTGRDLTYYDIFKAELTKRSSKDG